jgi:hypothetical protein
MAHCVSKWLNKPQAATVLKVSNATAYRHWAYARAWLHGELLKDG